MSITDTAPLAQARILAIKATLAAADFRKAMAWKYPGDPRNLIASQLLTTLANDTEALPDHLIAEINATPGLAAAAREVSRKIGFSVFPESFAELVHTVLLHAQEENGRVFPKGAAR